MKIVTWNINGIRSLKKNISEILTELDSDITCFQETKISRSQLSESIALIDGYSSYFSYPRKQSGYSGVATYCKDAYLPEDAEEGLSGILGKRKEVSLINNEEMDDDSSLEYSELDSEGRVIITYQLIKFEGEIKRLAVINVYCPCVYGTDKPERHLYKMQFCHLLETKAKKLFKDGCFVIIVGDLNIARTIVDHCDPGDVNEFNAHEARIWLNSFLLPHDDCVNGNINVIDAYRHFYPDKKEAYTCWNTKTAARLTNYGTRIDYVLISSNLLPLLMKCDIMSDYEGSDHCPVFAELKCDSVCETNVSFPAICTRLWPEFSGKQQTLKSFLKKTQALADSLTNMPNSSIQSSAKKTQLKAKNKQKAITSFFKSPTTIKNGGISENLKPVTSLKDSESEESIKSSQNSTDSSESVTDENVVSSSPQNNQATTEWKSLLKGPPKPPLCSGHSKECALRTVKKKGPNFGRQFYMCAQPAGQASNPDANCHFFRWMSATKTSKLK